MAVQAKTYLDLTGLTSYDQKIKNWSNSASQKGFKSVIKSADGNSLLFFKKPEAVLGTDTPDATIALGNADAQAQLEALAAIVAATYDSTNKTYSISGLTTTAQNTLVAAINELVTNIGTLGSLKTVNKGNIVASLNDIADKLGFSDATFAFAPTTVSVAAATDGGAPTVTSVANVKEYVDAKVLDAKNTAAAAIDSLDVTEFPLAEVNNDVVTIHGLSESNGKVVVGAAGANDIVLKEVAYTGAAADVSNTAITGVKKNNVATTNVQDTLEALKALIDDTNTDNAITLTSAVGTNSTLKTYTLYQGGTFENEQLVGATEIGTIDIPKDFLVKSATVKTATAGEAPTGIDVGKKYIDFVVNTKDADDAGLQEHIYLAVDDLIDAITTEQNATEVQLTLDANNVLSADIVDVDASKVTYIAADSSASPAVARESVAQALARIDGADTVDGSIAKAVKDAVESLDTTVDVPVATYDSTNNVVTFTGSLSETDGVIGAGSADTVTFTGITEAEIQALFA